MGAAPDNKRFEDFSILIKGPILQVFNRVFISDWCFASREDPLKYQQLMAKGPAANGDEHLEVRASGPDIQGDPLWEKLITLVQDCQQSMTLVTPYFVPDEVLFHSLLVKAKTGRQVRLMVPKQSNHRLVDLARHRYLRELARAGVDILLYRPRMLHAKLCIIDDRVAMIGSANLDMRSLFVNFEVGVFLTSTNSINQLQAWFNDRVKDCMPFARNGKLNVSEPRLFMEHLAHLLIPLL
jgi:cardiolipin synthase